MDDLNAWDFCGRLLSLVMIVGIFSANNCCGEAQIEEKLSNGLEVGEFFAVIRRKGVERKRQRFEQN